MEIIMQPAIRIPPTAEIRKNLAAAKAEVSYLRRLLPIAQRQEEAARLRAEAEAIREATPCR